MALAVPLRYQFAGFWIDGAGVAAANMNSKRHSGKAFDHRVVGIDGSLQVFLRVFAARAHSIQRYLIDISGVAWCVDLDIFAARLYDLGNHLPLNCDDMIDEIVEPWVNLH